MNQQIISLKDQALKIAQDRNGNVDLAMDLFAGLLVDKVLARVWDEVQFISDFDQADSIVRSVKGDFV